MSQLARESEELIGLWPTESGVNGRQSMHDSAVTPDSETPFLVEFHICVNLM